MAVKNENLAMLFQTERNRLGLSIREVARMVGTGYGHLCNIERGRHVNLTAKTLFNAQQAFGVSSRRLWAAARESMLAEGLR